MTIPSVHEWCRECRDTLPYGAPGVPADFILWGKLFPPEAFGPKCHDHAAKYVDMASLDQWAVYDLRPARALAAQIEAVETRRSRPWRRADRGRGDAQIEAVETWAQHDPSVRHVLRDVLDGAV